LFKIMLIEDDITLFGEIKERLSQWSYAVYGIANFGKVLQEFTEVKPDLVVIEIQLPQFDGFHWHRNAYPDDCGNGGLYCAVLDFWPAICAVLQERQSRFHLRTCL
jgi:CheY-like chemotaxis protein